MSLRKVKILLRKTISAKEVTGNQSQVGFELKKRNFCIRKTFRKLIHQLDDFKESSHENKLPNEIMQSGSRSRDYDLYPGQLKLMSQMIELSFISKHFKRKLSSFVALLFKFVKILLKETFCSPFSVLKCRTRSSVSVPSKKPNDGTFIR